jgi:hypothetical protein
MLAQSLTATLTALAIGLLAGSALAAEPPPRPKTLNNSPDPLLTLTPPLGRGGPPSPNGPKSSADPRDLEGVWWLNGYEYLLGPEPGVPPPLKPQYMKKLEERIRLKNKGTPEADASTKCFPHGMPRVMESPYPIEILQTPDEIIILHEVAHNLRRIHMNQEHPKNLKPTWLGHSVGHWEGDTLVIDTVGLNAKTFIDDEGGTESLKMHTVERIRKMPDGRSFELTMTVDDPETLKHPYSYKRYYTWRPEVRPAEYICEENNRNAPINGVTVAK